MFWTKTISPNSDLSTNLENGRESAGAGRTRTGAEKSEPRSRFRPDVNQAEERHPPIASGFPSPEMFGLKPSGASSGNVSRGPFLDLIPESRTIALLPPHPRRDAAAPRRRSAFVRPDGYRELETSNYDEFSRAAPFASAETSSAQNELTDLFSGIEATPTSKRTWSKWLRGLFVSLWAYWRRQREMRQAIASLSQMDDRTLRDIGIEHRLQIPHLVRSGRN